MLIIPTMYLRNQRVANPAPESPFHLDEDPVRLADAMERAGVTTLHCVDLDAPQTTGPVGHADLIRRLCTGGRFSVQIAGPIRTVETIDRYLQLGATRIVLGTIAYQHPNFTKEAGKRFPHRLSVEIQVRDGRTVIPGVAVAAQKSPLEYAQQFREQGISTLLYADVNADGQIGPENVARIRDFASKARMLIIHSTDLHSIEELERILLLEKFGVIGTLLSTSLYEGRFDIQGVVTLAAERGLPGEDSTLIPD